VSPASFARSIMAPGWGLPSFPGPAGYRYLRIVFEAADTGDITAGQREVAPVCPAEGGT